MSKKTNTIDKKVSTFVMGYLIASAQSKLGVMAKADKTRLANTTSKQIKENINK